MNPNLPGVRKTMRLVIGLMILAWATQTLLHQWGYGAEIPYDTARQAGELRPPELDDRPQEKFVPGTARYLAGATLEMRGETTIVGTEVKLKQVCRWSDADKTAFDPIADLVVLRVGGKVPFRGLTLDDLKQTLSDAGVNMAVIHFAGAISCTIERNDVKADERVALEQWIATRQGSAVASVPVQIDVPAVTPATAPTPRVAVAAAKPKPAPVDDEKPYHTLRDLLVADLAERLSIPPETVEIKFNPMDEKLLVLSEPLFRFNIDGRRARVLGDVTWDVTLVNDSKSQKAHVMANARAWQEQVIVNRPLAYRQAIQDSDLTQKRTLVNQLSDEPLLRKDQILGQLTARELKPGTLMTARMVEPIPLAKPGDRISVTVESGHVQVKAVARAMEGGTYGQTIKVQNEATKEIFVVTLTGRQTAKMTVGEDSTVGTNVGKPFIASVDGN